MRMCCFCIHAKQWCNQTNKYTHTHTHIHKQNDQSIMGAQILNDKTNPFDKSSLLSISVSSSFFFIFSFIVVSDFDDNIRKLSLISLKKWGWMYQQTKLKEKRKEKWHIKEPCTKKTCFSNHIFWHHLFLNRYD